MLADGLSLESGWQQISSGLQESFQYSGCFLQCCNLDGWSSNFQLFQTLVAATNLFPFVNQYPHQVIRPLIDQSRQSALIPSSSQELFFLVPFLGSESTDREQLASGPNRHLSHPLLLIPLGTLSLKNTLLLASHTLLTNQGQTY